MCEAPLIGSLYDWLLDFNGKTNDEIFNRGVILNQIINDFHGYDYSNSEHKEFLLNKKTNGFYFINKHKNIKCCPDCALKLPYICFWCGDLKADDKYSYKEVASRLYNQTCRGEIDESGRLSHSHREMCDFCEKEDCQKAENIFNNDIDKETGYSLQNLLYNNQDEHVKVLILNEMIKRESNKIIRINKEKNKIEMERIKEKKRRDRFRVEYYKLYGFDFEKYGNIKWSEMKKIVNNMPVSIAAKQIGVSDTRIRALCKKAKINRPDMGYWSKPENREKIKLDIREFING